MAKKAAAAVTKAAVTKKAGQAGQAGQEILPVVPVQAVTVPTKEIQLAAQEAQKATGAILALPVTAITTPSQYEEASLQVGRILKARKRVKELFYGTAKEPKLIRLIRAGLDGLYAFYNTLDGPLEQREKDLKGVMAEFKKKEREELERKEAARQLEIQRQERERERLLQLAEEARTPKEKARAEAAAEYAETQALVLGMNPVEEGVKAAGATAAVVKVVQVSSKALLVQAVAEGDVPLEALEVNMVWLRQQWKDRPEEVKGWDGVEVVEVDRISGRSI